MPDASGEIQLGSSGPVGMTACRMLPDAAFRLLELPPESNSAEIETRFRELRIKLEDKIAKAPTDGLRAKYRETLAEITSAFEALTLAADSSTLPVLKKERTEDGGQKTATKFSTPQSATRNLSSSAKKSGGKEFALVAVIAVVVLGAGGWWVLKTKAENEEKARLAAEAKAEQERKAEEARLAAESKRKAEEEEKVRLAAAAKAEQESVDKLLAALRAQLAELRLQWELFERAERDAERALSEAKSDLRSLRDAPPGRQVELSTTVAAREDFHRWLNERLARHPARTLRVRAEEFVSARAADEAAPLVARLAAELPQLDEEVRRERESRLTITGSLELNSEPSGLEWVLEDAFGDKRNGTTPARVAKVAQGAARITFRRSGWPEQRRNVEIARNQTARASADFVPGSMIVESTPAGAEVLVGGKVIGRTPLHLPEVLPGAGEVELKLNGYKSATLRATIESSKELRLSANMQKFLGPEEGKKWTIPDLALDMMPIAPGTFLMGSASGSGIDGIPSSSGHGTDGLPITLVSLSRPFWLGKTEVTQAQWQAVMGSTIRQQRDRADPSFPIYGEDGMHPIYYVSWREAIEYCGKLTEREQAAGRLPEGYVYTLPTEAQWEYACRAGSTGDYAGSLDAMGWYGSNSGKTPHHVGQKQANAWGLHDMHGNVSEWCFDRYSNYPGGSLKDPIGASSGLFYVIRGGDWWGEALRSSSTFRSRNGPTYRGSDLGFRLALAPLR